jgi:hypothetical protein
MPIIRPCPRNSFTPADLAGGFSSGLDAGAHPGGVGQQAVFFHDADGFHPGAHGQRVATEGGAVVARAEDVGGLGAGHHGADRHARAQALGQRHHVGLDARPLVGEPLAGAAHAALHLVDHHQPVAGVAQGAQACRYSARIGFTPPSPWMVSKNTATTFGLPSVAF